ncbi:sensor histidine kinase [Actinomadura litoris]|uniref:histidine kinase n=1 Tax=Actinomadura litoris TaxID=2678616 RepID=A0A7K1L2L0_9ACTN|nr:HAMP domain-containing sensor histidine kinase [Actinomadura litoris]MUN38476.1 sensor histidine kinase [Actinomadura litoris]
MAGTAPGDTRDTTPQRGHDVAHSWTGHPMTPHRTPRPARHRSAPLRRHLLGWLIGCTALAIVVSAVPLTLTIQRLYRDEAVANLDRAAQGLQFAQEAQTFHPETVRPQSMPDPLPVPGGPSDVPGHGTRPRPSPRASSGASPGTGAQAGAGTSGEAVEAFPRMAGPGVKSPVVGLYGPTGSRFGGDGPASSATAALALDGRIHDAVEDGQLTATAPLLHQDGSITVVRVGVPYARVRHRTERAWALIVLGGLLLLLPSLVAASRLAGRAARPVEQLAEAARNLEETVARERLFSADVAHQLRTPLTRLLLGLEAGLHRADDPRAAIRTAVGRGWSLVDTVEEMLQLAREDHTREQVDVGALLAEVHARRAPDADAAGRRLVLAASPPLPPVQAAPAALAQILDVLIDNALAHGAGTITVTAHHADPGLAVDVMDEGPGPDPDDDVFQRRPPSEATEQGPRHRIGLALARSLAHAEGGRLYLSSTEPVVFTLMLPAADRPVPSA